MPHTLQTCCAFFFNDTATTEIYTLSLHDALPILAKNPAGWLEALDVLVPAPVPGRRGPRSEEHTSELQSHLNLVCRLLLEKKKNKLIRYSRCNDSATEYSADYY